MTKEKTSAIHIDNKNLNHSPMEMQNKEIFTSKNFNLWYGDNHALKDINLSYH